MKQHDNIMFHTVAFAKYFQNGQNYLNSLFLFGKKQIQESKQNSWRSHSKCENRISHYWSIPTCIKIKHFWSKNIAPGKLRELSTWFKFSTFIFQATWLKNMWQVSFLKKHKQNVFGMKELDILKRAPLTHRTI